jgi:hypothetical protein
MKTTTLPASSSSRSLRFFVEMTIGEIVRSYTLALLPDTATETFRCRLIGRGPLCAGELIDCGINATGPYCLSCTNPGEKPCKHVKALTAARVLPTSGTTPAAIEDARQLLQEQQGRFEQLVAELDDKNARAQRHIEFLTAEAQEYKTQIARLTAEAQQLRNQRSELDTELMRQDEERHQVEQQLDQARAQLDAKPAPRTRRTRKAVTAAA